MLEYVLPALFGLTLLVGGWIIYRFLQVFENSFNARAANEERRQYFQLMGHMVEKILSIDPQGLAQLHAQERIHEIQQAATTERDAIQSGAPIHYDDGLVPANDVEAF